MRIPLSRSWRTRTRWAAGFLCAAILVPAVASAAYAGPSMPDDLATPGSPGEYGSYFDWRKAVPVLGVFLAWVWTLRKVDVDAAALRIPRYNWNALIFVCGLAGLLSALMLPSYVAGFALLLLAYAVPVSLYVTVRNRQVGENRRVLTPLYVKQLPRRLASRLGGLLGGPETSGTGVSVVFLGRSIAGRDEEFPDRHAQSSRGYRAAKELVSDAVSRRATDIHLEPKDDVVTVRIRIDGALTSVAPFDRKLGSSVINIFKVLSALDIADKRRSQDGSFRAEVDHRRMDFRVATQGTQHGEKLSLRILDPAHSLATLSAVGLRQALQDKLRDCIHKPHGLLLVCGPSGAGKTTTLYAALREIDTVQKNVITVEDPVEYKLDGVNQIEINTKAGQSFGTALRSLLRQDPDVLLIGEIRDAETAAIACQAANTGHMVLSTVHANDTVTALFRLLELGVEPYVVANTVSVVLGQRLVRRLCPECKEAFRPDPEMLEEFGLPADKVRTLYRQPTVSNRRCPQCGGTGHYGRIGVFEYLEFTPALRELVREKAAAGRILSQAREDGLLVLFEEGLGTVARGAISLDELQTVES
ncbi:MAG: GspE/PulE family protein [Planctomycetaceae bacterium]